MRRDRLQGMMLPVLSAKWAKRLLEGRAQEREEIRSSLDLGRSQQAIALTGEGAAGLTWAQIEEVAGSGHKIFLIEDGEMRVAQVFSEKTGWMRVLAATETAPTALVSGFPMHRIKDTDPVADTREKMKALGPVRGSVLDTATGLGYTAIEAARKSKRVVTIELDPAGVELMRMNPWSKEVFESDRIEQLMGDSFKVVPELPSAEFSGVIHDPPTMSLAGELYSLAFYSELRRVMKRDGILFHYIGDPTSGLGKRIYPGVMGRLQEAGFKSVKRVPAAYGVTAVAF